ncbi:hypothetical protein OBBRIDRAFT_801505 [Obba rivulosa]|uniref:Uncharacterized protein n=1 Tax=Obba rivulosa TaxID=1052685 RepID=A0A8E2DQK6_9APHY|nr:hypothetical protein OBBRIDRAFT_801505 [Obba rivulosa]
MSKPVSGTWGTEHSTIPRTVAGARTPCRKSKIMPVAETRPVSARRARAVTAPQPRGSPGTARTTCGLGPRRGGRTAATQCIPQTFQAEVRRHGGGSAAQQCGRETGRGGIAHKYAGAGVWPRSAALWKRRDWLGLGRRENRTSEPQSTAEETTEARLKGLAEALTSLQPGIVPLDNSKSDYHFPPVASVKY